MPSTDRGPVAEELFGGLRDLLGGLGYDALSAAEPEVDIEDFALEYLDKLDVIELGLLATINLDVAGRLQAALHASAS